MPSANLSVGQALVKTAQGMQDLEFTKQAKRREEEAALAAAKINFERDEQGNLLPPTLPIGDNGLPAPTIFDRAYTNMVGQRYIQQTEQDARRSIAGIANDHILDPDGFDKVSAAYIQEVTQNAPDFIKADVNLAAQKVAVEHFNKISRNVAEQDWQDSRNVQIQAIDRDEDEALAAAAAGDDELVLEHYIKMEAGLLQGQGVNFWVDAYPQARRDAFNKKVVSSYLIGEVIDLPNDEVAIADAKRQIQENFIEGRGTVKIVRDGQIVTVDVTEAIPDEAERTAIGRHAIEAANSLEAAFTNSRSARHDREMKNFLTQFMKMAVEAENVDLTGSTIGPALRPWLLEQFDLANASGNEPLKARIRAELHQLAPTEGKPDAWLTEFMRQQQEIEAATRVMQQQYANKLGVERFDLLDPEVQEEFMLSIPPGIGGYNLRQTVKGAEHADEIYKMFAPDMVWRSEGQGGKDLKTMERFIVGPMQLIGIVPRSAVNYFNNTLQNIEQGGGEDVMRVVSMFETMRETPNVRGKLKEALGEANYNALAFMADRMAISQMSDTAILRDVVEKAHKRQLGDVWASIDQTDRGVIKEAMVDTLQKYNDPWFGAQGAKVPMDLILEAEKLIPAYAHMLGVDPNDAQLEAIGEMIVEELVTSPNSGWRRDPLGLNADKAQMFGQVGPDWWDGTWLAGAFSQQPSTGFSQYPPIYWAEKWAANHPAEAGQIHEEAVMPAFQEMLDRLDSDVKLRAGRNAHLRYNAMESKMLGEPAYEIYITTKAGEPIRVTTDKRWNGEPVYFYPKASVIDYANRLEKAAEIEQQENIQRQERIEALRFLDLGH